MNPVDQIVDYIVSVSSPDAQLYQGTFAYTDSFGATAVINVAAFDTGIIGGSSFMFLDFPGVF
ncbi:MAG: hypothetical protein AAGD17_07040 [Bacteroidota bacterium]